MRPVRASVWSVLLLSACGPQVTFGVDARSATTGTETTARAVRYADPEDLRTLVAGPHAVGSVVPVVATRIVGVTEGLDAEIGPSDVGDLAERFDDGKEMRLLVGLLAEGIATLDVLDGKGNVVGTQDFEARPVAGAALISYDDLVVGAPEIVPVAPDGVIRIVEGFGATLAVVWLDAEGVPLTGSGLLDVSLVDPLGNLKLVSIEATDVPGVDTFAIRGDRVSTFPLARLAVLAGTQPIAEWDVEVLEREALTGISLVEETDYDIGGRVGWVQAIATTADGNRIIGPELAWTNNREPVAGIGSYAALVDGCASEVEACAPVTDVCATRAVEAEAVIVGSAIPRNEVFDCSHAPRPGGAVACALVALLALAATRRRRALVLALALAVAPAAHAQVLGDPDLPPAPAPAPPPPEPIEQGVHTDFSVRPIVAWGLHTPKNSITPLRSNVVLGLAGRIAFLRTWRPLIQWAGTGQASFTGMPGSSRSGWEARATGLFGPQFGSKNFELGITPLVGLELIVDRYRYYCRSFSTAFMISFPLMARVRFGFLTLDGGVAPSWFLVAQDRDPVDWKVQDLKGFGDEFEFRAGITAAFERFNVGLTLRTRVASYGDESWLGLGFGYSTFF